MKAFFSEKIEFITPAFLAGADQNAPEIRVPSIRGELRWWFRVIGATREEEAEAFGSVHGNATSSAVVLRVSEVEKKSGQAIECAPMSDKGYLYYFASVSGNRDGVHRTEAQHYLAPGTSFRLDVFLRRELSDALQKKLDVALRVFIAFGALGLRSTRGCGAIGRRDPMATADLPQLAKSCGNGVYIRKASQEVFASAEKCQSFLGGFLRYLRKEKRISGRERSALGFSEARSRAASALRLRPVGVVGGFVPLVVYTDAACSQPSLADLVVSKTFDI